MLGAGYTFSDKCPEPAPSGHLYPLEMTIGSRVSDETRGAMEFHEMLRKMVIERASDLFLKVGGPPSLRIDGSIHSCREVRSLSATGNLHSQYTTGDVEGYNPLSYTNIRKIARQCLSIKRQFSGCQN